MPLPHGEPHVLMRGVYARYSPTGHLLVITADGKLVAAPFDADKLKLTGSPVGLVEGIGVEVGGFSTNLALSANGTLVYTTGAAVRSRKPVWVTREGVESPVDSTWQPQGTIAAFSLSNDGRALAVDLLQNGNNAIWIKQIPSGPFSRLTFGDTANLRPSWSADGRSIIYLGNTSANGGIPMMRRADGTGTTRTLVAYFLHIRSDVPDPRWQVAHRAPLVLRGREGRHLRGPRGRLDAGAAGDGTGLGDPSRGLSGRAVDGVRVGRVGDGGDLRAPVPRRRVGAVAGLDRRRLQPDLVAQRQGAVLPEQLGRR